MQSDPIDDLIESSLAALEVREADPLRAAASRRRVLASFDEMVSPVVPPIATAEEAELAAAAPLRIGRRTLLPLAVAAAIALLVVSSVVVFSSAELTSIETAGIGDERTPNLPTRPQTDGLASLRLEVPAGFEVGTPASDTITLTATEGNVGFSIIERADGWVLEDRLADLSDASAVRLTRRAAESGGEFVDSFQVYLTGMSSSLEECAISAPCVPLVESSEPTTWLRAGYHHDVLTVERRDGTDIVVIAWTDQPYAADYAPAVNRVLASVAD